MTKLTKQELQRIRDIRIHSLLGIPDDGRRQSLSCPFHNEKTPSFIVDNKNGYHCFGCSKHGQGAIDFTMELMGCSFEDALLELVKYL